MSRSFMRVRHGQSDAHKVVFNARCRYAPISALPSRGVLRVSSSTRPGPYRATEDARKTAHLGDELGWIVYLEIDAE